MKFLFICGCLEPGKDGVGDYTRRLGSELKRQGHEVKALALYDRFVNGFHTSSQKVDEEKVEVFRLSNNLLNKKRFTKAKQIIDDFDPEWLSLQYVVFAFQKKGLPWQLTRRLVKLGVGRDWHLMFHELWVGIDKKASIREKIWGGLQERIISDLVRRLSPRLIHTQTPLYHYLLSKMGFSVELLPLFGNIRIENKELNHQICDLRIAVFGGLHYGARLKSFVEWLSDENTTDLSFHFIGQNGDEQKNWITILDDKNVPYTTHGWLPDKEVSKILSNCSLAVTSTPYHLVKKSGSVVTMHEHGLKVVCIGREWQPRQVNTTGFAKNNNVINWEHSVSIDLVKSSGRKKIGGGLAEVARQFLKQIKEHGSIKVPLDQ